MRSIQTRCAVMGNQPTKIVQKSSPEYQAGVSVIQEFSLEYKTLLFHQDDHISLIIKGQR